MRREYVEEHILQVLREQIQDYAQAYANVALHMLESDHMLDAHIKEASRANGLINTTRLVIQNELRTNDQ